MKKLEECTTLPDLAAHLEDMCGSLAITHDSISEDTAMLYLERAIEISKTSEQSGTAQSE